MSQARPVSRALSSAMRRALAEGAEAFLSDALLVRCALADVVRGFVSVAEFDLSAAWDALLFDAPPVMRALLTAFTGLVPAAESSPSAAEDALLPGAPPVMPALSAEFACSVPAAAHCPSTAPTSCAPPGLSSSSRVRMFKLPPCAVSSAASAAMCRKQRADSYKNFLDYLEQCLTHLDVPEAHYYIYGFASTFSKLSIEQIQKKINQYRKSLAYIFD